MITRQNNNARNILIGSFCVNIAIGLMLAYQHWSALQNPIGRSAILVAFVALLHTSGYTLYRDQQAWSRLLSFLRPALIQQIIVLYFGSIILISGLEQYLTAMILAYWATVAIIITRRPRLASASDLLVVRYGFAVMFVASFLILSLIVIN
jgi:hypothetical protein